jgi:hypothetical protein
MNIMNGSLKGRVYEGLEEKAELASAINEDRQFNYRIGFIPEDQRAYTKTTSDKER